MPSLQKNSVFSDLLQDESDMLYSAYGDDTGVQCALRYTTQLYTNWTLNFFRHFVQFQLVIIIIIIFKQSIQEFVKNCGSVTKRWVDGLLDKMTAGDHTKAVSQIRQVSGIYLK